ncbi:MAG: hypothetical protein K9N62_07900 [Verrucomicrobia bacterium]|jgi:hypothetical protein|nr:hypothetical protein [Verrucomicrobiota bacterium]
MNLYSINGPFKANGKNEEPEPESPLMTVLGGLLYAVIVAILLICV